MVLTACKSAFKEGELEKKISEFKEEVSQNQGEVIVSFRNIFAGVGRGGVAPGVLYETSYYEAGIISGGLTSQNLLDAPKYSVKVFAEMNPLNYFIYNKFSIPVKQKLITTGNLSFSIEELKKAEDGILGFDDSELNCKNNTWNSKHIPYITDFALLIGEREVSDFLKEKLIYGRNTEKSAADLIQLMKTPGEFKRRINKDLFNQRKKLLEELIGDVSNLVGISINLSSIKSMVMGLSFCWARDCGGRYMKSSDDEVYNKYIENSENAERVIIDIEKKFKKGEELDFKEYPKVNAYGIGFPAEVKTRDYLDFVITKVLTPIKKDLEDMSTYLSEAENKAGS